MTKWVEIKKEAVRVFKALTHDKVAKTDNEYIAKYYDKNAMIKDFEIYKIKKLKGLWKIELGKDYQDYQNCVWLNFWNSMDMLETSVFENCFTTISECAFTMEQMKDLKANGFLVYEERYIKEKAYGIVKDNENYNAKDIRWLNYWNGEQLAEDIKKINFLTLEDLSNYVKNNLPKYYYDVYKKGVLK